MQTNIDPILDVPAVVKATSLSRSTLLRLESRGQFPKRIQITPYRVGWRQSLVSEWLDARTTGKPAGPSAEAHALSREVRALKSRERARNRKS